MATEMKLPQLGENVDTGIILTVLVSNGERVERDQPLMELETDKATTEIPADFSGVIKEIRVEEGDEVEGGQTILTYEETDAESDEEADNASREDDQAAGEKEEVEEDEKAEQEPPEVEEKGLATDPKEQKRPDRRRTHRRPEKKVAKKSQEPIRAPRIDEPVPASPAVRQFARELGLAIDEVPGTGSGGRILEEDVKSHVRALLEERREAPQRDQELPDFSRFGEIERTPMTAIRRIVSQNVSNSWEQIPHVSQFDTADITDLERFRERFQDQVEENGTKLTVTSILLKIAAEALKQFPAFNSSLNLDRAELVEKKYVHIGVAVDTDDGLLVPVLRDADKKGLAHIAADLTDLSGRARARKISREELQGASFTITNLGGLGTTNFTPIIGWPQVAILAVGRAEMKPIYENGEFVARRMLPLGITYDHRAVDGADAARFLRWICETLEEPLRLTIGD